MQIDLDGYYRGLAAEDCQRLADTLLERSREAELAGAHQAAWRLADASTQLLDLGLSIGGQHQPRDADPTT